MTSAQIVVLIVLVVAIVMVAAVVYVVLRRASLRQRFGPEYERLTAESGGRMSAERELRDRERRHAELDVKPVDPALRERYLGRWRQVQEQFVTDPVQAVVAGDELVTRAVSERGYPTEVEHAGTLSQYREAHEIYLRSQRGEASTEDLRRALVGYRTVLADVLDTNLPESSIMDAQHREGAR